MTAISPGKPPPIIQVAKPEDIFSDLKAKFDKRAYQREYMRKRREKA